MIRQLTLIVVCSILIVGFILAPIQAQTTSSIFDVQGESETSSQNPVKTDSPSIFSTENISSDTIQVRMMFIVIIISLICTYIVLQIIKERTPVDNKKTRRHL